MKKLLAILIITVIGISSAYSQQRSFVSYYGLNDFYQAPPEAFKFGLYGFTNPAVTSYLHDSDLMLALSTKAGNESNIDRWGIFSGSPNSGTGIMHFKGDSGRAVTDYRFTFSGGNKKISFGLGYGFTGGDKSYFGRSNVFTWGTMIRPIPQLSVGAHQTYAFDKDEFESVVSVAVRPLASYPLALFADMGMFNDQDFEDARWSAGVSWEVLDGFRVNGRYFDDESIAFGVDISFGTMGIGGIGNANKDGDFTRSSYAVRLGALDRTIFDDVSEPKYYMIMDLRGTMDYQGYAWFGNKRTLLNTLETLDAAKESGQIKGVVINTSGMAINYEMLWEIREKLQELKDAGIKIYVFIDRMGMTQYHFASVADKIIMDKLGSISMEGFAMGRSYYKDMLEKVGVGFQEFRYFKYKSAAEGFARNDMSEGDREQRQALVDGWYNIARREISQSRKIPESTFDELVNKTFIYNSQDAMDNDLVDMTGRWSKYEDVMKEIDEDFEKWPQFAQELALNKREPYDDKWAANPKKIAVVYAIGACAMDDGINARKLSKDFEKAAKDKDVAAIVLRVDSPGGDAMASDYIADLVREYKGKKPIIVSQGFVAASGGYWLSMDADTILAAPMTITGSIGVIGSYFYDDGIQEKLGINTEIVSKGKFADLGYPFRLPLIPIGLPNRKFNEEELEIVKKSITGMYDEFVGYVADGRDMDKDAVHEIAQGRVWTGEDGLKKGLIDELGGLTDAIRIAAEKANIDPEEMTIVEYPAPKLFDLGALLPGMFGIETKVTEDDLIKDIKFRIDHNGLPMPMLPLDYVPYTYSQQ